MSIKTANQGTNGLVTKLERSTSVVTDAILGWWAHYPRIPGSFGDLTGLRCQESLNLGIKPTSLMITIDPDPGSA